MKRFIALLLSSLVSAGALAGTITVTITQPTQYEDNTPILAGEITQTRTEYGSCNGTAFGTKSGEVVAVGAVTSMSKSGLAGGDYCVRTFTTAKGLESLASNVVKVTVPQSGPKPPTITVIATQAFNLIYDRHARHYNVGNQIGTISLGTVCDPLHGYGDGYYAVDPKAVQFWGKPTKRVAAQCG